VMGKERRSTKQQEKEEKRGRKNRKGEPSQGTGGEITPPTIKNLGERLGKRKRGHLTGKEAGRGLILQK